MTSLSMAAPKVSMKASAGVTLNKEKCEFGKTTIKFLGHIISPEGISPGPQKTKEHEAAFICF